MILNRKNDIYTYFEVIQQLEPDRVLDIGMFFKRMGVISRQSMDMEVPENVILDGIDFFTEIDFPVWKNVYNDILSPEDFFDTNLSKSYDLAVMLGEAEIEKKINLSLFLNTIKKKVRYMLTDELNAGWKNELSGMKIAKLRLDDDIYYLVDFGV